MEEIRSSSRGRRGASPALNRQRGGDRTGGKEFRVGGQAIHRAPDAWHSAGTTTSVAQSWEARWRVYLSVCVRFVYLRGQQKWSDGTERVQACSQQRDSYIQACHSFSHTHTLNCYTHFTMACCGNNNPISVYI